MSNAGMIEQEKLALKRDIFISYKSEHVKFAERLFDELNEHGISAWFDKDILHTKGGEEYKEYIHNGIKNSRIFLLIYTKDVEKSDFILNEELKYAADNGIKICCYAKEEVDFKTMKPELKDIVYDIQWLSNEKDSKHISQYREAIKDEQKRISLAKSVNDMSKRYCEYEDINLFLVRIEIQRLLGLPTPYGTYTTLCRSEHYYKKNEIGIVAHNKGFFIPVPDKFQNKLKELRFLGTEHKSVKEIEDLWKTLNLDTESLMVQLHNYIEKNYEIEDIYNWISQNNSDIELPEKNIFSLDELIRVVSEKVSRNFINQIETERKTMFNGAMLGVLDISDDRTCNQEDHLLELRMYHSDYFTFKCTVELYHILRSVKDTFADIKTTNLHEYAPFLCSLGMGGFITVRQEDYLTLMWTKRSDSISSGDMWHFSFDETVNIYKDALRESLPNGEYGNISVDKNGYVNISPYKNLYRGIYEENGLPKEIFSESGICEVGIITSERLEIELLGYAIVDMPMSEPIPVQMRRHRLIAPDGYLEISKMEFVSLYDSVNNYTGRLLTPESYYLATVLQISKNKFFNKNICDREDLTIGKYVEIGKNVKIGTGCLIENYSTISDECEIGNYCKIHRNVFIDNGVKIGNYVKIQNNNSIYHGVTLEDGVFVGTNVCFTNDRYPRSINKDDTPVTSKDWTLEYTHVGKGASIGAGAVIRCGITIGEWAMIGCGAVVTKDVPAGAVVAGNPAQIIKN